MSFLHQDTRWSVQTGKNYSEFIFDYDFINSLPRLILKTKQWNILEIVSSFVTFLSQQ